MRRKITALIISIMLIACSRNYAQDITGTWTGKLQLGGGMALNIVFNISTDDVGNLSANMDSPDQSAYGIAIDKITFKKKDLYMHSEVVKGEYSATLNDSGWFEGTWSQANHDFPLAVKKGNKPTKIKRPQTPKPPYPYHSEDIIFENAKAGISLAGILTYPDSGKNFPALVMITGSGAQDRDEMIFQHRPFAVIADYLTRNGYAVLRFDDRGVGKSGGDFSTATSLDFTSDVSAAVDYLETLDNIDADKIGLIGHSEGGMIAPVVATQRNDIAFIIMLAGPAIPSNELMTIQTQLVLESLKIDNKLVSAAVSVNNDIYDVLINEPDDKKATKQIKFLYRKHYKDLTKDEKTTLGYNKDLLDQTIATYTSLWFRYFIAFHPGDYLSKVSCNILAVNGTRDIQVPYKENLDALRKINEGKGNITTMAFEGLNHLFQKCESCDIADYAKLEQSFSPDVLKFMLSWLNRNVK